MFLTSILALCVLKVRFVHAPSDGKKKNELEAQTVIHATYVVFMFPWPPRIVPSVLVVGANGSR